MITILKWSVALYITYYTYMYAKLIYKENNKVGAFAVGILALATLIVPLFIDME